MRQGSISFFLLERNYDYSYITENWNNTLKDVNKIQLESENMFILG